MNPGLAQRFRDVPMSAPRITVTRAFLGKPVRWITEALSAGALPSGSWSTSLLVLTLCLKVSALNVRAEDQSPSSPTPSIQQQLDALKEGQEKLFKELEQIRNLLQEKPEKSVFTPAPAPPPRLITLNLHGEPFRGESAAKVVVVEYSDFACPFCGKYSREVFPRLQEEYLKSGKVKYFFRDLPAPEHKDALRAAEAARCAGDQGKFWEMHDLLFTTQPAFSPADLTSYAQVLGLDTTLFNQCLSSNKYEQAIRRVAAGADRMGLYGTPVFLVGTGNEDNTIIRATKVVLGSSDLDPLKSALDEVLASVDAKDRN